jgi:hypothetical protein
MPFDIFDKEQGISTCIPNVVEILYSSYRNCKHFVLLCRYFFVLTLCLLRQLSTFVNRNNIVALFIQKHRIQGILSLFIFKIKKGIP